jgi:hypothetical protein
MPLQPLWLILLVTATLPITLIALGLIGASGSHHPILVLFIVDYVTVCACAAADGLAVLLPWLRRRAAASPEGGNGRHGVELLLASVPSTDSYEDSTLVGFTTSRLSSSGC